MEPEHDLGRLEAIVEKMLSGYTALQDDNAKLAAELLEKDRQIQELHEAMAVFKEDKKKIYKRVSDLIRVIESWEKTQQNSHKNGSPGNSESNSGNKVIAPLLNIGG